MYCIGIRDREDQLQLILPSTSPIDLRLTIEENRVFLNYYGSKK